MKVKNPFLATSVADDQSITFNCPVGNTRRISLNVVTDDFLSVFLSKETKTEGGVLVANERGSFSVNLVIDRTAVLYFERTRPEQHVFVQGPERDHKVYAEFEETFTTAAVRGSRDPNLHRMMVIMNANQRKTQRLLEAQARQLVDGKPQKEETIAEVLEEGGSAPIETETESQ